jgi:hypothetical protein
VQVADISANAFQEPRVLCARHRLAYAEFHFVLLRTRFSPPSFRGAA